MTYDRTLLGKVWIFLCRGLRSWISHFKWVLDGTALIFAVRFQFYRMCHLNNTPVYCMRRLYISVDLFTRLGRGCISVRLRSSSKGARDSISVLTHQDINWPRIWICWHNWKQKAPRFWGNEACWSKLLQRWPRSRAHIVNETSKTLRINGLWLHKV